MSRFEDNLWGLVVDRHGDDLARSNAPVATRPWPAPPRLVAGATGAVAASATAAALLLGATASSPAFAVTRNSDGSVSVRIARRSGIPGANAKLAAMGIRARVTDAGPGHSVQIGCLAPSPSATTTMTLTPTTSRPAGGSGNSGNSGAGNTGAGNTGARTTYRPVACSSVHISGTAGNTGG